jgi:AmiR/NasT family two-component response regulator
MTPGGFTEPTTLEDALRLVEHLQRALETRGIIGQAHGILMERYDLDSDAAFLLLKRLSSTTELKVRDVSEQIVAGVSVESLGPPSSRASL